MASWTWSLQTTNPGRLLYFSEPDLATLLPGATYDAGPHPSAVVVADIDGSGKPSVLVSNESEGTISVLLGNGDGTLQPRQSYAVGFNPSFIATGGFNGNGNVDVAVAGKSGSLLAIFLNGGNGSLKEPFLYSLSKTPTALTAADFNNDGHADVALANADGTVSILLGQGAGCFALFQTSTSLQAHFRLSFPKILARTARLIWWLRNRERSWCQS